MKILLVLILISLSNISYAKKNERYYQNLHCIIAGGKMEYRLKDKTRIDCLTSEYAIEYDWAKKWAECLGQALHYSVMKNKKPVCGLIGTKKEFDKYYKKIKNISDYYNLPVKIIHIKSNVK